MIKSEVGSGEVFHALCESTEIFEIMLSKIGISSYFSFSNIRALLIWLKIRSWELGSNWSMILNFGCLFSLYHNSTDTANNRFCHKDAPSCSYYVSFFFLFFLFCFKKWKLQVSSSSSPVLCYGILNHSDLVEMRLYPSVLSYDFLRLFRNLSRFIRLLRFR